MASQYLVSQIMRGLISKVGTDTTYLIIASPKYLNSYMTNFVVHYATYGTYQFAGNIRGLWWATFV